MSFPYVFYVLLSFADMASCFRKQSSGSRLSIADVVGKDEEHSAIKLTKKRRHIVPVVDPIFAGSALGTMTVAKVATAVVSGVRYKKTKHAFQLSQKVTDFIAKRRAGTCLIARQLQMQSTLAHGIVYNFVDSAAKHVVAANTSLYDASAVEMLAEVDRAARASVAQLQNTTRAAVVALRKSLERLVQSACHSTSVNEFLLLEKTADLKARYQALTMRVVLQSMDAFFYVSNSMNGLTEVKQIFASSTSVDSGVAWAGSDNVDPVKLHARWDAAVRILVGGLEDLSAKSKTWAFFKGSTQKLLSGLGGLAQLFVTASMWYNLSPLSPTGACLGAGELGCEVQTMFLSAIVILENAQQWMNDEASLPDILGLVVAVLTLADEVMGLAGANMYPGLAYARLTLRALEDLLSLTLNALALADEEREFAVNNARARSTAIGHALTYTRSTCSGLYDARVLAKEEENIVISLAATLSQLADGDSSVHYDKAAAGASYASFCFLYPALCNGLSKFLRTEPSIADFVAHHKATIRRLSETAPISDLAFLEDVTDNKSYYYMGFRKVKGLASVLACRGCVSSVVFHVALMDTAETLTATQEAFARAEDNEGQMLPEYASLNFVQYSSSHHQVAFYKAHLDDLMVSPKCATCKSHQQALVDLRELHLRMDDVNSDMADGFRGNSRSMLEQQGAVVLSWRKTEETRTYLSRAFFHGVETMNRLKHLEYVKGDGHTDLVNHYDMFTALVAVFLPKEALPASVHGFQDWRDAVPTGLSAPFRHASVLKGCGCELLFFSEFVTFRPEYPHAHLRNVRVKPILQPKMHEQKSRCGWSVGVWLSSAPLSVPGLGFNMTFPKYLKCRVMSEAVLAEPVERHQDLQPHDMGKEGPVPSEVLATVNVPGVLNFQGQARNKTYAIVRKQHRDRSNDRQDPFIQDPEAVDWAAHDQMSYKQLEKGGPLTSVVAGLTKEICEENLELGSCTFADETLEAAVDTVFKGVDTEIRGTAPSFMDNFESTLGHHFEQEGKIDAFKQCNFSTLSPTLPQVSQDSTLEDIEAQLGGPLPITTPEGENVSLPYGLHTLGEVYYDGNCDFTWWAVFAPCAAAKGGYVYADSKTGVLRVDCDAAIMPQNAASALGPVRKIFLRVSFGDGHSSRWGKHDKAHDHISTRDGFVLIAPPEASEYVSQESWHNTKRYWHTKARRFRVRAYAQLDPRIEATRDSVCSGGDRSSIQGLQKAPDQQIPLRSWSV